MSGQREVGKNNCQYQWAVLEILSETRMFQIVILVGESIEANVRKRSVCCLDVGLWRIFLMSFQRIIMILLLPLRGPLLRSKVREILIVILYQELV